MAQLQLPKDDIRRPLYLAARSMRLLGIVMLCLAGCVGFLLFGVSGRGGGFNVAIILIAMAIYIIPGIMFIICAVFLKQGKQWAIIVGIVLASLGILFGLLSLISSTLVLVSTGFQSSPQLISFFIALIFVVAFIQLVYHLSLSFKAIQHPEFNIQQPRGFEPLVVRPLEQQQSTDQQ